MAIPGGYFFRVSALMTRSCASDAGATRVVNAKATREGIPVRGYAKGCDAEKIEFFGIAV